MMLPTCIHVGEYPERELFQPVHDAGEYPYHDYGFDKPNGGLWTSTAHPEHGSDWLRFLLRDGFHHDSIDKGWACEVQPTDDASVLVINSSDDYNTLRHEWYPNPDRYGHISWEALAEDWDIVHVKAWDILEAWDCETVIFLKWEAIKDVKLHRYADLCRQKLLDHFGGPHDMEGW